MNVLFLSAQFPSPVGPHRAVFNRSMVRGLASRHHVRVVCPVPWTEAWRVRGSALPPQGPEPFAVQYPLFYFPPRVALHRRGSWMWWSVRRLLKRETRRERPDIILSYWAHPDGEVALRLGRHLGVPVALMVGGSDVLVITSEARRRDRVHAVLRGVDAVLTIGENLRRQVIATGVPASHVTSMMRPVAARFTPGDRTQARLNCGVPLDATVVLWIGRLVPVKDVDTLVRAFALLRERDPAALLCVVGNGPQMGDLRTLADELNLGPSVRWLGAIAHDGLPDWYRAADVTALPSLSEGVPNVLLESIACGTPFVASRVGSIPEIADEACDRLVAPGDPVALAAALREVLAKRSSPPVRVGSVAPESEFQAKLDIVLRACVHRPRQQRRGATLRSATLVKPNQVRQIARGALLQSIPRQCLVAAGTPASRAICLTFDDGPHEVVTPRILDVLKEQGAVATFFVIGDRASAHPAIVRRIVDEGHLLGHHSWSHSTPHETSAQSLLAEVSQTREWFRRNLGRDSRWFRPPHGKVTVAKVLGLWAAGQTVALWNVDPGDVFRTQAREMLEWFAENPPQSGDVVLLHDTTTVTLEALPELIGMVRANGLELTTLDRFGGWQLDRFGGWQGVS